MILGDHRALGLACAVFAGWCNAAIAQEPSARAVAAEAPIVGGNAASAKQRALEDAFRQSVEQTFAVLMAEAGVSPSEPPPPGLLQLKSTFFSRAKRYVRGYRVLEESAESGRVRLQVEADVDEGLLRRDIDRARGAPSTAVTPAASVVSVVVSGSPPEASRALVRALGGAGLKAETSPLGMLDESKARELASRNRAAAAIMLSGQVTDDGPVRGTSRWSASCRLTARLLPIGPAAASDRSAEGRAFSDSSDAARAECLARAAGDVARQTAGSLATGAGAPHDARAVGLEVDLVEPAVLPLLLRALKKVGTVSSAEVRRVTVGHVEIRAVTSLTAPALVTVLARELTGAADVTPGQASPDRAALQVRLAAAPPAPAPAAAAPQPPSP